METRNKNEIINLFTNLDTISHKPDIELSIITQKMSEISRNVSILESIDTPLRRLNLRKKIKKRRGSILSIHQNSNPKNKNSLSNKILTETEKNQIKNSFQKKLHAIKVNNCFSNKKQKPKNPLLFLTDLNLPDINSQSIQKDYSNFANKIIKESEKEKEDKSIDNISKCHLPYIPKRGYHMNTIANENKNSKSIRESSKDLSISSNHRKKSAKNDINRSYKDFAENNSNLSNRINSSRKEMNFYKQIFLLKLKSNQKRYFKDEKSEEKERNIQLFRDLNELTKKTGFLEQHPFFNSIEELVNNLEYNIKNKKYKEALVHKLYYSKEDLIVDEQDLYQNKSELLVRSLKQIDGRIKRQNEMDKEIQNIISQNQQSLSNINSCFIKNYK